MSGYYSDQLSGPRSRTEMAFDERSWGGIVAIAERGIATGTFAEEFPEQCPDGRGVCGTDERSLRLAVLAEHPEISWPLDAVTVPEAPAVLDLVEFLHGVATEPIPQDFHSYYSHHHFSFNQVRGQKEFREQVNRIFARNSLAYELEDSGRVRRLVEPVLHERLREGLESSGDERVDELVAQAEDRFLDPDPINQREALEKLWDAFERVKTVLDPDKKTGATALIHRATSTRESAELIDGEMNALTGIGNGFHIRHHETTRHPVADELVDYLFVRMYALLRLLFDGLDVES